MYLHHFLFKIINFYITPISLGGLGGALGSFSNASFLGGGAWIGPAISGGLNFLGARDANKRSQNQFDSNYKLARDQLYSGYSIAARDLKNAGINPILAGKWGPASTSMPAMSNFQNTGQAFSEGYNTMSTAQKSQAQQKMTEVQTKIQQHAEQIIDDFHKAWNNSGQDVMEWIANANWSEVGQIVGNRIGMATDQVTTQLEAIYGKVENFIKKLFNIGSSGPVKGDATHPTYQSAPMTGKIQR